VVHRGDNALVIRLLTGARECILLMEEHTTTLNTAPLESLRLTRREADILVWIQRGKTNREIGMLIGTSPRTVSKHLEHIFEKLGVRTRTAAAIHALPGLAEHIHHPAGPEPREGRGLGGGR
jgi:DNA-binding CsgD family transcriptional regulator